MKVLLKVALKTEARHATKEIVKLEIEGSKKAVFEIVKGLNEQFGAENIG